MGRGLPRAALVPRLPGAIIMSSLRDFSLARYARASMKNQDRTAPSLHVSDWNYLTIASGILLQQKAEQPERNARRRRQNDEQSDNLRRASHYGNSIDVTLLRQVVSS